MKNNSTTLRHNYTNKKSARNKSTNVRRRLILFNKPFGVLCQFRPDGNNTTLSDFIKTPGFYAAGRLDKDSEGLLLLTDDGKTQHKVAHPDHKLPKTYLVQVEGQISKVAIEHLTSGVKLKDGLTKPSVAEIIIEPDHLWPRQPPIRVRKQIPTSWIKLTIAEGRNRQVRRMTAATGFPTLRLIRQSIGPWNLGTLQPGEFRFVRTQSSRS